MHTALIIGCDVHDAAVAVTAATFSGDSAIDFARVGRKLDGEHSPMTLDCSMAAMGIAHHRSMMKGRRMALAVAKPLRVRQGPEDGVKMASKDASISTNIPSVRQESED